MKPQRMNIYVLGGDRYALINRALYALTPLTDDEIAEAFNNGDALPLMPRAVAAHPHKP